MKKLAVFLLLLLLLPGAFAELPFGNRTTLHSNYDPNTAVSDEAINLLLSAAFSMPTGGGQRSLEFFVVTERETMAAMRTGHPYSQALDTAPLVIVLAGNSDTAYYPELQEMDAGIATGAMLIQAAELGLTTCCMSISPQVERIEGVRNALGMSEKFTPILMIAFGYPGVDTVAGASVDNWSDDRVHR